MPTLGDFAAMRPSLTATRLFAAWLEIGNGIEVPAASRFAAPVRALTSAAGFVVGCDRDLIGCRAPGRRGRPLSTSSCTTGIVRPATIAETKSIRDRVMTRFLVLHERVRPAAEPELLRYLTGSVTMCAASWTGGAPHRATHAIAT